MAEEMNLNERYMKMYKWRENPFSFKILPDLFVGYMNESKKISSAVENNDKISVLVGPTGSGKTTLLKYLSKKFDGNRELFYLPKPPKRPEDWIDILTSFIGLSLWERITSRSKRLNLYNLGEWVNKKMKDRKMVMMVDESHEASLETLEWLRTLSDQADNMSVLITGLPILEEKLRDNLETFVRRVNTVVRLSTLTRSETRELIKRRIEWAGGDDIKPFTSETVEHIYRKTGGFPRETIKVCNELVKKSMESDISTIDMNFLNESKPDAYSEARLDSMSILSPKQRRIAEVLGANGKLTPSEIVDEMDVKKYSSKDNAVRSINNILKRLVKDEIVIRERTGKSYRYSLSDKIRTMMIES